MTQMSSGPNERHDPIRLVHVRLSESRALMETIVIAEQGFHRCGREVSMRRCDSNRARAMTRYGSDANSP
jgi:hypothetical protein